MRPADLLTHRAFRAIALSGVALGVAGGAAVAAQAAGVGVPFLAATPLASSPPPAGKTSAPGQWCTDFLGHLSTDLGVSPGKLQSATQQAARQTIQGAVAKGKLTQAQASRLERRLSSASVCREVRGLHRARAGAALRGDILKTAAGVLKLTPQQLIADLRQGQSLASIAKQQGIPDQSTFRSKLAAALKPQLDAAVKSGALSSAQETKILDRVKKGPIPFWDHGMRPRGDFAGSPQAPPSGTTA
ncbi:MAG: hypothetical protein ACREPI_06385 [Candidatus Dormibacterales bacterium]